MVDCEAARAGCTVSTVAVVSVSRSVVDLGNWASDSALHVRVGPGVVPGLSATSVSCRWWTIVIGVSVGTAMGVVIASARK